MPRLISLRVVTRLLLIGLVLVVGILLTLGAIGGLLVLLAGLSRMLFPNGIGPDDDILGFLVDPLLSIGLSV